MTKSKIEDRAGEEVKPDGLEIASIGALYSGPWDKKYWSCSRGKDRHPYPIGYQALRAHNGISYKMEIHEGSKGPLFVVSSADGYYCSGQTPDIAWEKFQKKGCVRMNILHGKRFSSKIDGVEFFGFKNPFVQRLLRELVANVNGANDSNSLSSTLCSKSSGKENMPGDHMCRDGCSYPDLLTFVSRPQITGKRSRRHTTNSEQANGDNYKRSRKLSPIQILKASKYVLLDKSNHIKESSILSLPKDNIEEAAPVQDAKHIFSSECSKDAVVDEKQTSEEEPPDRSHLNIMEKFNLTMGTGNTGPSFLKHCPESPDVCGHSLYAPVTRDLVQDISGSTLVVMDKNNHFQEDEVAAADLVTSEMPVMATRLGVIDSSDIKLSSENSDFESAGEEMAKSMMTFLLPQAVPLLQKASKQKKISLARLETASFEVESKGEKLRTEELVSVPTLDKDTDRKEDLHTQKGTTYFTPNIELAQSLGFHSLDQNQCTHDLTDAVQATPIKETNSVNSQGQHVSVYLPDETLVSHAETHRKNAVDKKETGISLGEWHSEDNMNVPVYFQGSMSTSKQISCEKMDTCKDLVGCEIPFEEKNLDTAPAHVEGVICESSCSSRPSIKAPNAPNDNDSAKPPYEKSVPRVEGAETGMPLSQVTSRVYCRKKVLNSAHSTRKYNKSLFKKTVEKTFVDSFAPKDSVFTEPLHSSEVCQVNFLPDGQQKNDLVPAETKLGGKTNGFVRENVSTTSQGLIDNKCADKSHDQESTCLYPDEDSPGFLYASTLLTEKLEVYIDEEVAKHKNISEGKHYKFSNQNESTLADKCTSHAAEVGMNSDKNHHCSGLLANKCAAKSHDQESMCFCQDEDSPGFLYASTLLTEKLEVYIDEEVAKHKHISEGKHHGLSNQNEPTLADKCTSHAAEVGINSDRNPRCSGLLANKCAAKSHDQKSMCLCQDEDSPGFLYASTLLTEKLEVYIDEEVVKQTNISGGKSSKLSNQNEPTLSDKCLSHTAELEINSARYPHCSVESYQELERMFLLGCYSLPMPVLSLWLSQNATSISICVLCGHLADKNMTLLVYNVDISELRVGYPCLVGHTSVTLPIINDYLGREIALETSGFQLTPNGNSLVLLDGIRTPYCREGKTNCSCYTCTSHSIEENAVKVVQVKFGYASIVTKFKAVNHLHSILVCKPNHLVAVGESGRMHLWVMNSNWSVQNESYVLPSNESISPGIVELKKIPKFADLVVGHNGFGEFTIWNISKRSSISKFSSSRTSIYQFFPVCLFSWRKKGPSFNYETEEHVNEMMMATNKIFSETTEKLHLFGEDISICLFVLTEPDYDRNHDSVMNRQWKLALLADNMVTFGTPFESSVCAIGASAGQGIIGTGDGLVYMWELSTGSKIGTLLRFNGASVTCIATDDTDLGAVAVAGNDKLLVYLQTRK